MRSERALLNEDIKALQVRLIGADGAQVGIVPRSQAMEEARNAGMDLVLIAPDSHPPVCKVLDYGKQLFDQKKTRAVQRKKQKQMHVKEVKFRPGTEEADYQIKLRNLRRFIADGDKAKASVRFRGRELAKPEFGHEILSRVANDLDEVATIESEPKFEGRQIAMVMIPRKRSKKGN